MFEENGRNNGEDVPNQPNSYYNTKMSGEEIVNSFGIEFNPEMNSQLAATKHPVNPDMSAEVRQEINRKAKQESAKKNRPNNWKPGSYSQAEAPQALIKFREKGIGVRYPDTDTDSSDLWFIILDFDSEDATPFSEIVQDKFIQNHALFAEKSYSNDGLVDYKYHIFFAANRLFSYSELEGKIKLWAKSKFPGLGKQNESFKFKQVWFAPKSSDDVFVFSPENRLNIDELEVPEVQPKIILGTSKVSTSKFIDVSTLTGTEAFLEYVHQTLKQRSANGELDVPSILSKLGIEVTKAKEYDGVQEFDCDNPWSESNNSGTSLFVKYDGDRLFHGVDRTAAHLNRNSRNHYTFLDLFHQSRLVISESYREKFGEARSTNGQFKAEFFLSICNQLTSFFDIEPYRFKSQLNHVIDTVLESFKDQVVIVQNSWSKSVCDLFVFSDELRCWEQKDSVTFGDFNLPARAYKLFPNLDDLLALDNQIKHEQEGERKTQRNTDLKKVWRNLVKDYRFVNSFKQSNKFIEDINLVAFDDSLLDLTTKEIIPNEGQARNLNSPYKGLKSLFEGGLEKLEADPDIQKFKTTFHKWSKCDVKGEMLLLWFIVNTMRQGYKTRRFLCLTAPSKSGKTSYFKTFIHTMNQGKVDNNNSGDFASFISASSLFSNYEHQSEKLEKAKFFFVDEVDIDYKDFGQGLRKYVQDDGVSELANPKGKKTYVALYRFGIGVVFEEKMTIATTSGLDGRAIYVDLRSVDKSDSEFSNRLMNDRDLQDKILVWCLLQDKKLILERIKELALHPVFVDSMREKKADNDLLYQFIVDRIEITGNKDDRLSKDELFASFQYWVKNQITEYVIKTSNRFMKEFLPLIRDDENDIRYFDHLLPTDWLPKHTNKGNFYCGLKLKDTLNQDEKEF
ncbi:hypothetical protein J5X98_01625 [Leptothermofonsia sichuanensis E412]|uniref:hypothetical protein n=1 Tax=Leptothermofonsia sichuanensis TaxID=2917832 RepID=UPI001CA68313|nr:hypothetical protein [Leptothermofonsia sichuanensis]QZZ21228.1 hypothetical protein J5X98_01625 [Leptothermofonsia sichuanensis E412]